MPRKPTGRPPGRPKKLTARQERERVVHKDGDPLKDLKEAFASVPDGDHCYTAGVPKYSCPYYVNSDPNMRRCTLLDIGWTFIGKHWQCPKSHAKLIASQDREGRFATLVTRQGNPIPAGYEPFAALRRPDGEVEIVSRKKP